MDYQNGEYIIYDWKRSEKIIENGIPIKLCYDFHSVMALIYSNIIDDDKEYYTKLADYGEYSKMLIEAVQANWDKPHPLYLQVLKELKQIYEILENQSKIKELDLLINSI